MLSLNEILLPFFDLDVLLKAVFLLSVLGMMFVVDCSSDGLGTAGVWLKLTWERELRVVFLTESDAFFLKTLKAGLFVLSSD